MAVLFFSGCGGKEEPPRAVSAPVEESRPAPPAAVEPAAAETAPQTSPFALIPLDAMQGLLEEHGPLVVMEELRGRLGAWEEALRNVSTGEAGWIAVAQELQKGCGLKETKSLQHAVSNALLANPDEVMKRFSVEYACVGPNPDDAAYSEEGAYLAALNRLLAALSEWTPEEKAYKKDLCIEHLRTKLPPGEAASQENQEENAADASGSAPDADSESAQ